jgi:ABC-type Fe3+/spermidine/putrescine transport system ATPase subunit
MTEATAPSPSAGAVPSAGAPPGPVGAPPPGLDVSGVEKSYGATKVLHGVDLSVDNGEIVALLGPSGSGKTTLLSLVAGFIQPDAGRIRIGGKDTAGLGPRQRRIGVMFQNYALFPHMSVRRNIAFGLKSHRVPRNEQARRIETVLELTQLQQLADRMPSQLSGGQQQRVALARALVIQPDLVLLDEPFSGLDAQVREHMRIELTRELRSIGATALLITHDQADAAAMADRVAVIDDGMITQIGTYDELYRRPASRFIASFVGESNWFRGTADDRGSFHISCATGPWVAQCVDTPGRGETMSIMVRRNAATAAHPGRAADPSGNGLTAPLLRVIPSGPTTRLVLDIEGTPMVFDLPPHAVPDGLADAPEVTLELDPEWTRAYAEEASE